MPMGVMLYCKEASCPNAISLFMLRICARTRCQQLWHYLEKLRGDHESAAGKIGLLVQGDLQQALDECADARDADICLHRLEQQAQEHGRLVGVAHVC